MIRTITQAFVLMIFATGANAVVVGDKDWLQVTSTAGFNWNDFDVIFDTTTGICDVAGCLLDGSINLSEYIWANNADVNSLFNSYHDGVGLSDSNIFLEGFQVDMHSFFDDFEPTFVEQTLYQLVYGFTRESRLEDTATAFSVLSYVDIPFIPDGIVKDPNVFKDQRTDSYGGWFYKPLNPVPVPAAVWLFGTALIGLVGFSKRRKVA